MPDQFSNTQNNPAPKHFKSFWPMFIILVVAVVAGGIIYFFAYNNSVQDEVDSTSFLSHFFLQKNQAPSKATHN